MCARCASSPPTGTCAGPRWNSAKLPDNVELLEDAVPSEPSLRILFLEYHKLIARYVAWMLPG